MNENNVAYQMSLRSRECLKTKDKARWLAMWAEDGIIEDPIGPTILDPDGKGHSTPAAREAFYDRNIANSDIEYIIHQTYTAHLECANIVTLNVVMKVNGKTYSQQVNGVFTYSCNEEGKLTALRGFWEFDEGMATFKEIEAA
ncbi:MAG: nuclear transport factor 2 family protein [Haliea sp.]|jgi:steroid delta-isomerase|nr:nuclear transport factor 2 family protein [Haliea sp.]